MASSTILSPCRRLFSQFLIGCLAVAGLGLTWTPGASAQAQPAQAGAQACAISTPAPNFAKGVAGSPERAQIWRLYQAFFLRQPDAGGFSYWLNVVSPRSIAYSQGPIDDVSLTGVAYYFASGPEFQSRYGSLSNAGFVDLVYQNVLCRDAEPEGRAHWINALDTGAISRSDLMISFSEGPEYLDRTATCHSVIYATNDDLLARSQRCAPDRIGEAQYCSHLDRVFVGFSLAPLGEDEDLEHHYLAGDLHTARLWAPPSHTRILEAVERAFRGNATDEESYQASEEFEQVIVPAAAACGVFDAGADYCSALAAMYEARIEGTYGGTESESARYTADSNAYAAAIDLAAQHAPRSHYAPLLALSQFVRDTSDFTNPPQDALARAFALYAATSTSTAYAAEECGVDVN